MAKRIIPSPDTLRKLIAYDPETGLMTWHGPARKGSRKPGDSAMNTERERGYLQGGVCGITLRAHRVAWAICHGEWPDGQIDHINGNRRDNRIANLRVVTPAENCRNAKTHRDNTSGVPGVGWHARDKRWRAKISHGGRSVWLGHFPTREEAIAARKAAEARLGYYPGHGTRPK